MCTGAHVLAAAGLLSNKRCAIHWENLPGFSEAFPKANVFADLFEVDQNIYTCAGGTAALDMMLKLIGDDFDENLVNRVCEQVLTDRVRSPTDRQRLPLRARLGVQNAKVLSIIELMEANLSEPLSLIEVADHVGLSRRQIERLFRTEMGRSPARYYLEIRLDRARHLLIQSSMPVVEVAVACGFVSASHFSKCYRELYSRSPQQERLDRKQLRDSGLTPCLEGSLADPTSSCGRATSSRRRGSRPLGGLRLHDRRILRLLRKPRRRQRSGEFQHQLAPDRLGKLRPVVDRDHEGAGPADHAVGVVPVEIGDVIGAGEAAAGHQRQAVDGDALA